MKSIRIYARAKINLTLDVLRKRDDGYHDVRMIMQTLKLADIVDINITDDSQITLKTNLSYLPTNEKNIAYKAILLFFKETGIENPGVLVDIHKKIPVSAGLAGGSTNAAAVLIGLNKLFETNLSVSKLMYLGGTLGADVPFCIYGGTMLSEGIGQLLTPLTPIKKCKVVLCKPNFSVSTASVYSKIDAENIEKRPDTNAMLKCIKQRDFNGMCNNMYNVLEDITAKLHPEINKIKDIMKTFEPSGVMMSGSGPTVFALFQDEEQALQCVKTLRKKYRDTHITQVSTDPCEI